MIDLETVKQNKQVKIYLQKADENFAAIGYKEHGMRHAEQTAKTVRNILASLGYVQREIELGEIAGYLHDIGNVMGENIHAQTSATLTLKILLAMNMSCEEASLISMSIGCHEDKDEDMVFPTSIAAALIISDKTDVQHNRVRKTDRLLFDLHDRVNFAAKNTDLKIDSENKIISLELEIDTNICSVMEYFELFLSRIQVVRKAAQHLGCQFNLYINQDKFL